MRSQLVAKSDRTWPTMTRIIVENILSFVVKDWVRRQERERVLKLNWLEG